MNIDNYPGSIYDCKDMVLKCYHKVLDSDLAGLSCRSETHYMIMLSHLKLAIQHAELACIEQAAALGSLK